MLWSTSISIMKAFVLIVALIGCVCSLPAKDSAHARVKRDALSLERRKWPMGKLYYQFDSSVCKLFWKKVKRILKYPSNSTAAIDQTLITSTLNAIESRTCVRFIQGTTVEGDYVSVTYNNADDCHADIGYAYDPGQKLNLAKYCMNIGGIAHEFMHSMGFIHQHQVPDRDTYIEVIEDNIRPIDLPSIVRVFTRSEVKDLKVGYDYRSVLHYAADQGAKVGKNMTIRARMSGGERMGQREEISEKDFAKINKLYDCPPRR